MADRRLSREEAALWARVASEVRPLHGVPPPLPARAEAQRTQPLVARRGSVDAPSSPPRRETYAAVPTTLDSGWDRRIARGRIEPDGMIDLHGHSLASAHARLDAALEMALARGDRVLLLITGKPPRPGSLRPYGRGAIRAAIEDWLAVSRHAGRIAAIRRAHPRHGGAGALYVVLRRPRTTASRKS